MGGQGSTDDGLISNILTNVFTPTLVLRHFAPNDIVIHLLDLSGDRPGHAIVDGTEIDLPQADHLGGSAAHKDLTAM